MKRVSALLALAVICGFAFWANISHRKSVERAAQRAAWERMKAERRAEQERSMEEAVRRASTLTVTPAAAPAAVETDLATANPSAQDSVQPKLAASAPVPNLAPKSSKPPQQTAPSSVAGKRKKEWADPLAREALGYVGLDAAAEVVWAEAIANPELPPKEREDLIEDLNEEGFPDPKHITMDDLPLIVSRLALIEDYASAGLDEEVTPHFQEAYKDLLNMYVRLVGQ